MIRLVGLRSIVIEKDVIEKDVIEKDVINLNFKLKFKLVVCISMISTGRRLVWSEDDD